MAQDQIGKIIIHCADTPDDMDIGVDEIRDWHVNGNGWSDIGYHYVIRRNGIIETGRDEDTKGAHVRGHNSGSIGICMVGGKPECNFTSMQWSSLELLVENILSRHVLPASSVYGHRDLDIGKTCPQFDARAWASTLGVQ